MDGEPQPPMPRVVIDTQVVLDRLVFRNAAVDPLFDAIEQCRIDWIATAAMRTELAHMLGHRSLARWQPEPDTALAAFDRWARLLPPRDPGAARLACRDPDDQVFIDTAMTSGARWLLTRDRALLALARRALRSGLLVLPPERWTPP